MKIMPKIWFNVSQRRLLLPLPPDFCSRLDWIWWSRKKRRNGRGINMSIIRFHLKIEAVGGTKIEAALIIFPAARVKSCEEVDNSLLPKIPKGRPLQTKTATGSFTRRQWKLKTRFIGEKNKIKPRILIFNPRNLSLCLLCASKLTHIFGEKNIFHR